MDNLSTTLEKDLLTAKPTLVEFYDHNQLHSRETLPTDDKLRDHIGNRANLVLIDTSNSANEPLAKKYHIHATPTWILFVDGQEAWRTTGRLPLSELVDMLHRFE